MTPGTGTQAVEAILKLGEGITPGPWDTRREQDVTGYPTYYLKGFGGSEKWDNVMHDANIRAIAAVPAMLDLICALAAERDDLAKQLRSRLELLDSTAVREARTSARRTAFEEAAKACDKHAADAFANCDRLSLTDTTTGVAECSLEVRGGDCLCQQVFEDAETMARAIRALIEKEQK